MNRRKWLGAAGALALGAWGVGWLRGRAAQTGQPLVVVGRDQSNFQFIYGNAAWRARFRDFLANVFHLYPEVDFDELIADCVSHDPRDPAVYLQLERRLGDISPFLGALRYSLPALDKQKVEMAQQTTRLLGAGSTFNGYLEIGSHGRYLDQLREHVTIGGPIYSTAMRAPTHSPADVVDRGSLGLIGTALPWTDYAPVSSSDVEPGSLGLISVYIGLHHTTEADRAPYVRSLHRALGAGGKVIIRDHDVRDDEFRHLVALAHDVFNVGTGEIWATNERERRNFYSLDTLTTLFEGEGFFAQGPGLVQAGDPTKNTLLCFVKSGA